MARTANTQRGNRHGSPSTLRTDLLAIIERAFALLDRLDDDPDLEDGGDCEPSLACPEGREYQVLGASAAMMNGRCRNTPEGTPAELKH